MRHVHNDPWLTYLERRKDDNWLSAIVSAALGHEAQEPVSAKPAPLPPSPASLAEGWREVTLDGKQMMFNDAQEPVSAKFDQLPRCHKCGAELKEAHGIGLFCPNKSCSRGDDLLRASVEPAQVTAPDILKKAAALIEQRGVERDKPQGERTMDTTVAAFWALHGESILRTGTMTETQGWEFMELLKMARSAGGCYKADDYEDKVAYAALAAEAAARGKV
jgi:hypothetical protein